MKIPIQIDERMGSLRLRLRTDFADLLNFQLRSRLNGRIISVSEATGIVFMRLIATLLLFLCGLPVATSAQTLRPVALPIPSPFPASSVIYQWDYTCPNSTAGSVCFSSLGFPVTAISLFLVEFPIGNSTILMSCYIATLPTQTATTGWNTSCTDEATSGFGFSFSQRGMTLNYAGNPNAASMPRTKNP
jgi:hypothetical protein